MKNVRLVQLLTLSAWVVGGASARAERPTALAYLVCEAGRCPTVDVEGDFEKTDTPGVEGTFSFHWEHGTVPRLATAGQVDPAKYPTLVARWGLGALSGWLGRSALLMGPLDILWRPEEIALNPTDPNRATLRGSTGVALDVAFDAEGWPATILLDPTEAVRRQAIERRAKPPISYPVSIELSGRVGEGACRAPEEILVKATRNPWTEVWRIRSVRCSAPAPTRGGQPEDRPLVDTSRPATTR